MSRLLLSSQLGNIKTLPDIIRFVAIFADDVENVVNGQLEFGLNLKTSLITCVFEAINTEQGFNHGLDRVPQGYILVSSAVATTIFSGATSNTAEKIYLQSTALGSTKVLVF